MVDSFAPLVRAPHQPHLPLPSPFKNKRLKKRSLAPQGNHFIPLDPGPVPAYIYIIDGGHGAPVETGKEKMAMMIDGKAVDAKTVEIDNVRMADYPDFCDAYFCAASFTDGTPLTVSQIDTLNADYSGEVNAIIHNRALYA